MRVIFHFLATSTNQLGIARSAASFYSLSWGLPCLGLGSIKSGKINPMVVVPYLTVCTRGNPGLLCQSLNFCKIASSHPAPEIFFMFGFITFYIVCAVLFSLEKPKTIGIPGFSSNPMGYQFQHLRTSHFKTGDLEK